MSVCKHTLHCFLGWVTSGQLYCSLFLAYLCCLAPGGTSEPAGLPCAWTKAVLASTLCTLSLALYHDLQLDAELAAETPSAGPTPTKNKQTGGAIKPADTPTSAKGKKP
jgi:hypothetical protein